MGATGEKRRMHEALQREGGSVANLRGRIAELEGLIGKLRRDQTALEAENGTLRTALASARAEAERCVGGAAQLVAEKSGAEQMADKQAECRLAAEKKMSELVADGARLRSHNDALRVENADLWQRLKQFEAENVVMRGQLRGADVLAQGLRGEVVGLHTRLQHLHHSRSDQELPRSQIPSPLWEPVPTGPVVR